MSILRAFTLTPEVTHRFIVTFILHKVSSSIFCPAGFSERSDTQYDDDKCMRDLRFSIKRLVFRRFPFASSRSRKLVDPLFSLFGHKLYNEKRYSPCHGLRCRFYLVRSPIAKSASVGSLIPR